LHFIAVDLISSEQKWQSFDSGKNDEPEGMIEKDVSIAVCFGLLSDD
jgi:hypothetical protein